MNASFEVLPLSWSYLFFFSYTLHRFANGSVKCLGSSYAPRATSTRSTRCWGLLFVFCSCNMDSCTKQLWSCRQVQFGSIFFHLRPKLLVRVFPGTRLYIPWRCWMTRRCIATCLCASWRWPSSKQKRKIRDWGDVFVPRWFCALSLLLSFILGQFFFLVLSENSLRLQCDKFCWSSFLCVMHCLHKICSYALFHHGIYYVYLSEEIRCAFW